MVENGARFFGLKDVTFTVEDRGTYVPASIDNLLDENFPSELVCNFLNNLAGLSFGSCVKFDHCYTINNSLLCLPLCDILNPRGWQCSLF